MKLVARVLCRLGCHWQRRSRLDLSSGHLQRYCGNCGLIIDHKSRKVARVELSRRLRSPVRRFSFASALIALTALLILIVAPHIDFRGQPADAASSARLPEARPHAIGRPGWTDQVAAEMLDTELPGETVSTRRTDP